ncbi:hypothetical protein BC351_40000 [Paenibacillus ferrarius]|uniref:Uncharacterized protein n=1 Tax=Paenibacillus ferrarius TaxID=1469647 RepID=A0A1V4H8Q9_9BACL|nr:hypothetical protein [Paenibacillus ferrarius]OPH47416.1 hypothetical protein BC351_40000 [Paenibacillus ferrarius]
MKKMYLLLMLILITSISIGCTATKNVDAQISQISLCGTFWGQQKNIIKSIGDAPWVGLEHFKVFWEDDNLGYVIC